MDDAFILVIAFVIFLVLGFFLSSVYIKKKTKDIGMEAKKALYIKNKKRRTLVGYLFIAYMIVNILIALLFSRKFSNYYQVYSIFYGYGLVFMGCVGSFYTFNHYKLEKIVFGKIL